MADLVTHACTALLPGAFVRSRWTPVVTLGTVLPDALGRAVPIGLERAMSAGAPLPDVALVPWTALHTPLGCVLLSALLATGFLEPQRRTALGALLVGCALHFALDLAQDHAGEGYVLFAPFSVAQFELGWIGSEATVEIALPLLVVTALAWSPRALAWVRRQTT